MATLTGPCGEALLTGILRGDYSHVTTEWVLESLHNPPNASRRGAALWYADQGVPVFPCNDEKEPLTRHGFKDAVTDPDRITAWWTEHPDANPAMPTGTRYDVIDVDGPAGHRQLAARTDLTELFTLPVRAVVYTPRPGGVHYWIDAQGDRSGPIDDDVDCKADGGYVILPPAYVNEREKGYQGYYRFSLPVGDEGRFPYGEQVGETENDAT